MPELSLAELVRRRVAVDVALPGALTETELVAELIDREEILGAEWAE